MTAMSRSQAAICGRRRGWVAARWPTPVTHKRTPGNGRKLEADDQRGRAALSRADQGGAAGRWLRRSEEHTSELLSPCISYAVFCLKKKKKLRLHIIAIQLSHVPCTSRTPPSPIIGNPLPHDVYLLAVRHKTTCHSLLQHRPHRPLIS